MYYEQSDGLPDNTDVRPEIAEAVAEAEEAILEVEHAMEAFLEPILSTADSALLSKHSDLEAEFEERTQAALDDLDFDYEAVFAWLDAEMDKRGLSPDEKAVVAWYIGRNGEA